MPTPPSSERYVIPNLRNACRILKTLGRHPDGLKVADLARELGIPVTTTLRIMATLHLEGLARKGDGGRYELGSVLIQLGNAALAGTEIREQALPVLQRLTAATDETSHLAIPCDEQALIVAVQDSPHPLRASSRPGFLAQLHCSATGKIFLTHLYPDRLPALLAARPTRRTPATLTTLAGLKREIELTRKRGFSLDDEEFNLGVRCLAAPVFASDGKVVAAIGITASSIRFTKERIPEMAAKVRVAATELSQHMGHLEHHP